MQDKSHNLSPVFERIDHFRIVTNQSWDKMAELLECDRSMFFHVKSGRRNLSKKALFRLEEAERAAGITPPNEAMIRAPDAAPEPSAGANQEKLEISSLSRDERIAGAIAEAIAALQRVHAILAEAAEESKPEAGKGGKRTKKRMGEGYE